MREINMDVEIEKKYSNNEMSPYYINKIPEFVRDIDPKHLINLNKRPYKKKSVGLMLSPECRKKIERVGD